LARRKRVNVRLLLLLIGLGTVGIIALIPYELSMFDLRPLPPEAGNLTPTVIVSINTLSKIFMLIVFVFLGERMLRRTNLDVPYFHAWVHKQPMPRFSIKWLYVAIGVSLFISLVMIGLDHFLFLPQINIPLHTDQTMSWWHGLFAMFYGGITEELMVRFFGMTFIVWLLSVIMRRQRETIPKFVYMIAIIGAALLFGLSHLPATEQLFGQLTPLIILRALVLNGLPGIWFGYLYYRKGLEYAMIAHLTADFFLHVLFVPLF